MIRPDHNPPLRAGLDATMELKVLVEGNVLADALF